MTHLMSVVRLNDVLVPHVFDGVATLHSGGISLHLGDAKYSCVQVLLEEGESFTFDGVGRDVLIPHFESVVSGHASDGLQSDLFESYSRRFLDYGSDPLHTTGEDYPLSGVVTAVENALFSNVDMLNYVRPGVGDELAELVRDSHLQLVNVRGWRDTFPIYQRGYPVDSYLSVAPGSVELYQRVHSPVANDVKLADLSDHYDDIVNGLHFDSLHEPLERLWGRPFTDEVYRSLGAGLCIYKAFPIGTNNLWEGAKQ